MAIRIEVLSLLYVLMPYEIKFVIRNCVFVLLLSFSGAEAFSCIEIKHYLLPNPHQLMLCVCFFLCRFCGRRLPWERVRHHAFPFSSKEQGNKSKQQIEENASTSEKVFTDDELVNLIDPIFDVDDTNKDGYIDYPEFVRAQQKSQAQSQNNQQ